MKRVKVNPTWRVCAHSIDTGRELATIDVSAERDVDACSLLRDALRHSGVTDRLAITVERLYEVNHN